MAWGLATVYRTLQAMAEAGEVDPVRTADYETLYCTCGRRHHHHVVCRGCGLNVELHRPSAERWATKAAEENGFTQISGRAAARLSTSSATV